MRKVLGYQLSQYGLARTVFVLRCNWRRDLGGRCYLAVCWRK